MDARYQADPHRYHRSDDARAYSMRELEELTRELNGPGYAFETGELSAGPVTITWLAGRPRGDSSERPVATLAEPGSGESV